MAPLTSNAKKRGVHDGLVMPHCNIRTLELPRVVIETRSVTAATPRSTAARKVARKAAFFKRVKWHNVCCEKELISL